MQDKAKDRFEPLLEKQYVKDDESTQSESSTSSIAVTRLEPKKGVAKFFLHLRLLLYKNLLLFWRSKKVTLFQILTPIISVFVMWVLQSIFTDLQDLMNPDPWDNKLPPMPNCVGKDCVTIGYFIVGDSEDPEDTEYEWIHHTMAYVAKRNKLELGIDVKQLVVSNSTRDVKQYLDDNKNKTWYGAVFCTSEWEDNSENSTGITIPCRPQNHDPNRGDFDIKFYSILYNYTLMPSYFLSNWTAPVFPDQNMLIVKNSIDSGIVDYLKSVEEGHDSRMDDPLEDYEDPEPHITISWGSFPLTTARVFNNADISSLVGTFYVSLGPIVTFVVVLTEVVREKELKLRQGLSVVGLSHLSYWLHWIITGIFFSIVVSLTTIIIGVI